MTLRSTILWVFAGTLAVLAWIGLRSATKPFAPVDWQINAKEAETIALERFRDLGEPVEGAYLVTTFSSRSLLERRLHLEADRIGIEKLRSGELARRIFYWEVSAYAPGATPLDRTYLAEIGLQGQLLALRMRLGEDESAGDLLPAEARARADGFLLEQGFALERFNAPEVLTTELENRTDTVLRYRQRTLELGEAYPYGVEIGFAGDRLSGHRFWFDDPEEDALTAAVQPFQFLELGKSVAVVFLLPLVAIPFLRRYHAGEIGVRRALEIGGVVLVLGLILMAMTAGTLSQGSSTGVSTRVQMTWLVGSFFTGFVILPVALMTMLSWSVGESISRQRYPEKLAAFDALFKGEWNNETVASSSLRGLAAGGVLTLLMNLVGLALSGLGTDVIVSFQMSGWWYSSHWAGVVILVFFSLWLLSGELFGRLFLVSWLSGRFGVIVGGGIAAIVSGLLTYGPSVPVASTIWFVVASSLGAGFLVLLFVRYDLLTSLTAAGFSACLAIGYPMASASDDWLQFQGALPIFAAVVPALLSVRSLTSGRRFQYRYDDIPPHVRRIADRERQKVELETARRIQSSILPDLPEAVNGFPVAHAYMPATEVGGDFYDVLALEDGRLAVAVGDVAGHGVSSGLVMSMAKSALAVQVSFRPEVPEVFATLNRMIYQSARKRLLTTLCYALIDPKRKEVLYASAGHLFPYRVTASGRVDALESVSYPLGVRDELSVTVQSARLDNGDKLFLFSDGVVEAHRPDDEDLFGFERLEASLSKHAAASVSGLRDGILADLAAFTHNAPREDDLTVLVLQVP